jgi:hypothetical protein
MLLTGIAMIGMWSMFLLTGQVPELQTKPWNIAMHLAAEFTTAVLLLIAGLALLRSVRWARRTALFALGMLVYTVIQSPGYYLDPVQPVFVVMFAVLGVLAVLIALRLARMPDANAA